MIKVKTCQNHLPQLYEALKSDQLSRVKEIEHQLTPEEECVACGYIFKAKGEAKEAFSEFLNQQGFIGFDDKKSTNLNLTKNLSLLLFALAGGILIAYLNYQIIFSWFGKNGPADIGSIEVSYVSMGKFILDFGTKTWAPFWYLGFPFHVFYTPLLPFFEALLNKFFSMPLWETYRFLTGWAFVLAPVSVFLFTWQLTKKVYAGVISGFIYSITPTIFYFILGSGEVAKDKFSADFWDPRRFTILVRWGEGPHLFSLIFAPLAGLFFVRLLEKPSFKNLIPAAVFLGACGLTNAIGFFAILILFGVLAFVKFSQSKGQFQYLASLLKVGVLSLGLISFWYNLEFIGTFFKEGGGTSSILISLFPWGWILGIVLIVGVYYLLSRYLKNFALASSLIWFLLLFLVVYYYYASAPPDESSLRVELLPQALRYAEEVNLSLAILIGVIIGSLFQFIQKRIKFIDFLGFGLAILIGFLSFAYIKPFIPIAVKAESKQVNLNQTSEKKIADFLASKVDQSKGERVFVPGNYGFYLNWFNYIWQGRGGLFQASTNKWTADIYYQLANGFDPQISDAWFVATNTNYAVITTPASAELYKEMKNLDRFTSYQKIYDQNGDLVYKIPLKKPSLAKSVSLAGLKIIPPKKADDKQALFSYTNWLENSSSNNLDFKVIDNDNYQVTGNIGPNEAILIQMTYDSAWGAYDTVSKTGLSKGQDPLGYLVLYPKKDGQVNIILKHHISWKEWLGYLITLLTLVLILLTRLPIKKSKLLTNFFYSNQS